MTVNEIDEKICEAFWQMSEEPGFPRLALAQYAQAESVQKQN